MYKSLFSFQIIATAVHSSFILSVLSSTQYCQIFQYHGLTSWNVSLVISYYVILVGDSLCFGLQCFLLFPYNFTLAMLFMWCHDVIFETVSLSLLDVKIVFSWGHWRDIMTSYSRYYDRRLCRDLTSKPLSHDNIFVMS